MTPEAEKIVAWLRAGAGWETRGQRYLLNNIAARIERGDHLVWKPEPTIKVADWIDNPSAG